MKHGVLHGLAHNVADSLSSGCSMIAGLHMVDAFRDAARSPGASLRIDVLSGDVIEGRAGRDLSAALYDLATELPAFVARHRADVTDFRQLEIRFFLANARTRRVADIFVTDARDRVSRRRYCRCPLRRVRTT